MPQAVPAPPSEAVPSSAQVFGTHPPWPESRAESRTAVSATAVSRSVESTVPLSRSVESPGAAAESIGLASPASTASVNSPSASGPATTLHDVDRNTTSSASATSKSAHKGLDLKALDRFCTVTFEAQGPDATKASALPDDTIDRTGGDDSTAPHHRGERQDRLRFRAVSGQSAGVIVAGLRGDALGY